MKNNTQHSRKSVRPLVSILLGALLAAMIFAPMAASQKQGADGSRPTIKMFYKIPGESVFRSVDDGKPVLGLKGIPTRELVRGKVAPLANNVSFDGFVRFPAEQGEQFFQDMTSNTSYYRDAFTGGQTSISGAANGDRFDATITFPTGAPAVFNPVTYDGNTNCFLFPTAVCGSNSITIIWFVQSQCGVGNFSGTWSTNGTAFFTGQYNQLPRTPPNKVPLYNQGSYTDAYDTICRTGTGKNVYHCDGRANEVAWTIKAKGCALSSAAMVLGYHHITVDPPTLNTWLIDHNGYDSRGNIYWDAVARYARTTTGRNDALTYLGANGNLENAICANGPAIVSVKSGGHWVTAIGRDQNRTTYLINDPDGGVETSLAAKYNNTSGAVRRYSGPEFSITDVNGLVCRFHSPGELLITDALGRRTGTDPLTGQSFNEIPNSSYDLISLDDLTDPNNPVPSDDVTKDLELVRPPDGEYTLRVTGTGTGTYDLENRSADAQGTPSQATFTNVPITPGAVHTYIIQHSKAPGSTVSVAGGFDGGGQRPRDVNKFLTYIAPGDSPTNLPTGTTTFSLLIVYGQTIIPSTFNAQLNGVDITNLFNPVPGTNQMVNLSNLTSGRNVLQLSVSGNLPSRVATDSDRLIFMVQ